MFEHFPYTNFHELNLDWLLKKVRKNESEILNVPNQIESAVKNGKKEILESEEFKKAVADEVSVIQDAERFAIFIGDSYTQANSLGDDQNLRFSSVLSRKLGLTEINVAVGGSGFTQGTPFYDQALVAKQYCDNNNISPDKISYVFICGGRNDAAYAASYTYTQASEAVRTCIAYCESVWKNIILVPMLYDYLDLSNSGLLWYSAIYNTALERRCSVIKNAYKWLNGRFDCILNDLIHPTAFGHQIIADCIYSALISGEVNSLSSWLQYSLTDGNSGTIWFVENNGKMRVTGKFTPSANFSGLHVLLERSLGDRLWGYSGQADRTFIVYDRSTGTSAGLGFLRWTVDTANRTAKAYVNTWTVSAVANHVYWFDHEFDIGVPNYPQLIN